MSNTIGIFSNTGIPYKAILNEELFLSLSRKRRVIPLHLYLSITNKCNLNCNFCSFSDRNKEIQLTFEQMKEIIRIMKKLGTKVITLLGGGEPLCHPNINNILELCIQENIKVGLSTNGYLLGSVDPSLSKAIEWCRISFADDRTSIQWENLNYIIEQNIKNFCNTDFTYSYVLLTNANYENQINVVKSCSNLGFGNVRFVSDMYSQDQGLLDKTRTNLTENGIDISKCTFEFKPYVENPNIPCRVPLLKPVISADGYVYPCCGIQYTGIHDFTEKFRICYYDQIEKYIKEAKIFDSQNCSVCFQNELNRYLNLSLSTIKNKEWM